MSPPRATRSSVGTARGVCPFRLPAEEREKPQKPPSLPPSCCTVDTLVSVFPPLACVLCETPETRISSTTVTTGGTMPGSGSLPARQTARGPGEDERRTSGCGPQVVLPVGMIDPSVPIRNIQMKFAVLDGLVQVGQVSDRDIVETVLNLSSNCQLWTLIGLA
ncbi:unnamed protein product [Boreogadus saida]